MVILDDLFFYTFISFHAHANLGYILNSNALIHTSLTKATDISVANTLHITRINCPLATTKELMNKWIDHVKEWFTLKPRFVVIGNVVSIQVNGFKDSIYFSISKHDSSSALDLDQFHGMVQTIPNETALVLTESMQSSIPAHLRKISSSTLVNSNESFDKIDGIIRIVSQSKNMSLNWSLLLYGENVNESIAYAKCSSNAAGMHFVYVLTIKFQ